MSAHEREGSSSSGEVVTDESGGRGHARERSDGTDETARTSRGSVASEATTKASKGGETPLTGSLDSGPSPIDTNVGEAEAMVSHRRASYTYQSYPHQPSPLSPRPRPPPRHSPQAQAQAQLHPHSPVSPTHVRRRSQASPSRPGFGIAITTTASVVSGATNPGGSSGATMAQPSISPPGAIPTSQAEVDIRLKKMNETFLKSLAGLGDGWTSGSGSGTRSNTSRSSSIERRSEDGTMSAGIGSSTRGSPVIPGRGRDRSRIVPGGLANLSQQGSEEVIGAIELVPDGRQHSLDREQLGTTGSLKPPTLMRHRGY